MWRHLSTLFSKGVIVIYILGVSAFYHDSAACLVKNGDIIAAAQEERFTRKKHDAGFPINAIQYCLREASITSGEISYVVYYEKPFLKFERLLETYLAFAPRGLVSFIAAMPVWLKDKLFQKLHIIGELKNSLDPDVGWADKLLHGAPYPTLPALFILHRSSGLLF